MSRARRLPLAELEPYLLPVPQSPFAWESLFSNPNAVEIEVGFGKGLYLLTAAQERPHTNFVGIEVSRKFQLFSAARMAKRCLSNVRLAKADAREFIQGYVASSSIAAVHVYFPDPWWKKRHLKRRVFTPAFVVECERVLQPGGLLHVATDVLEYFQVISELLACRPLMERLAIDTKSEGNIGLDGRTNFERKFKAASKHIYRGKYRRK